MLHVWGQSTLKQLPVVHSFSVLNGISIPHSIYSSYFWLKFGLLLIFHITNRKDCSHACPHMYKHFFKEELLEHRVKIKSIICDAKMFSKVVYSLVGTPICTLVIAESLNGFTQSSMLTVGQCRISRLLAGIQRYFIVILLLLMRLTIFLFLISNLKSFRFFLEIIIWSTFMVTTKLR